MVEPGRNFNLKSWLEILMQRRQGKDAKNCPGRRACITPAFAVLSVRIVTSREDFGLRWQLAEAKHSEDWNTAATPLFDCGPSFQSGVAPALRVSRRTPKNCFCVLALKSEPLEPRTNQKGLTGDGRGASCPRSQAGGNGQGLRTLAFPGKSNQMTK